MPEYTSETLIQRPGPWKYFRTVAYIPGLSPEERIALQVACFISITTYKVYIDSSLF